MIRIILPLAVVGMLLFGPLVQETSTGSITGERVITSSAGDLFLGQAFDCAKSLKFDPRVEGCGPTNPGSDSAGITGWGFYAAAASSAVAGILGVIGLLPFIGRLTSLVTTAAGGVSLAAIGNYVFQLWQNPEAGIQAVQWGGWGALGLAFLTLVSGFMGMGGSRD